MAMSEEQKKAVSERMKAMHAKKKTVLDGSVNIPAPETTFSAEEVNDLLRRVKELEQRQFPAQQSGVQVGPRGMVGTFEKYIVDPANYPNPVDRLKAEARLQRFAFPLNYDLNFEVSVSSYETKDGINTKEPRFLLQLINIVMDEDTGEPTNGRFMSYQMIFHEDPQAALIIARDNGVDVEAMSEKSFLDEMRYLRMRDWLMDIFYPRKARIEDKKTETVIGNRVVEVYEVSSENTASIPFSSLSKKL